MKIAGKIQYLEALRCLAIILVVLNHVVTIPLRNWTEKTIGTYQIYTLAFALGNCGVPLFLMISGSLLLDQAKVISLSKIYKQMIPRILLPLCILGFLFAGLEIFFDKRTITISIISEAVLRVLNEESWDHLWYLYMLIGIYIFLPILRHLALTLPEKTYLYFTVSLIIVGYVLPTINAIWGTKLTVKAPMPLYNFTYFWMGHALIRYTEINKSNRLPFIGWGGVLWNTFRIWCFKWIFRSKQIYRVVVLR